LRAIAETGKLDLEARANIDRLLQAFQEKRRVGATPVTLHARGVPAAEAFEGVLAQAKLKVAPQSMSLLKDAKAIDVDVERAPVAARHHPFRARTRTAASGNPRRAQRQQTASLTSADIA
jgi:hypothetical protein